MAAPALELQGAIVAAVRADSSLMALIADIYDRPPADPFGDAQGYVTFGPEDTSTETGCVGIETVTLQLDVWSRRVGRVHAKQILHELTRVVFAVVTVENPIVSRGEPFKRIIEDPDGVTTHGILQLSFGMETRG
ncbi:hypothetical protein CKO11_12360 [Rhodobacter sp. TJ_12]|uniref:DUF3168 domain-containing protein n=1 Tax=Rhodobacter sp. TJ_12 TaxID=2029399 RepID=UPI001CC08DB7|nr:DUF3168 domain-containing protein [Rhodobacter sp. TJ_12]MBZ4023251.1 hypothetical protein [Rhodobacter sp. TJ_12]